MEHGSSVPESRHRMLTCPCGRRIEQGLGVLYDDGKCVTQDHRETCIAGRVSLRINCAPMRLQSRGIKAQRDDRKEATKAEIAVPKVWPRRKL
jgi:hypothetical protein